MSAPDPSSHTSLLRRLHARVDNASLALLRVAFGAIMLWEVGRYFSHGWIDRYWIDPSFHFTYYGFEWVRPWAGDGMYWHMAGLGVAALLVTLGLFYRVAAAALFVGFTYTFLLEQARYLNHFYLVCLISLLMVLLPAHRAFSLDARRRPGLRSSTAPAWALLLLRAQIAIPYLYGGLAKLNADWLAGEPMRTWLAAHGDRPLIGPHAQAEWLVAFFSLGGLLFDLAIVPLLVWRKTRVAAYLAALCFHLTNAWLFQIGIFPWFMIAATTLFFEPDWPRRVLARLARRPVRLSSEEPAPSPGPGARRLVAGFVGLWLAVQLLVPLRHHLYPGNPSWTEEGHRFAWHMKLRTKRGELTYEVREPASGQVWRADPDELLPSWQARKLAGRPDMILQYAHHLAEALRDRGHPGVEVYAHADVSLNGRPRQLLVHPAVDLAAQPRTLAHAEWIVPLTTPLRGGGPEALARSGR